MSSQHPAGPIAFKIEEGVARLTLSEAARGNPIDGAFCSRLLDLARQLSGDNSVRAVLIEAEGKAFSYGGDIAAFTVDLDGLPAKVAAWARDLNEAIVLLQQMDAPIVVAAHGVCAGGMAGFVAGADIVVASTDIAFVAAYAGIGFCCDAGASVTLAQRMGTARARRYFLLNETIAGDAALATGLIDELVDREVLPTRASAIARQLATGPTRAFGEIRRLLHSRERLPLADQLALEAEGLARSAATSDAREGLTSFAAKRRPVFTGE